LPAGRAGLRSRTASPTKSKGATKKTAVRKKPAADKKASVTLTQMVGSSETKRLRTMTDAENVCGHCFVHCVSYGRPMEYGRPLCFCPVVSSFFLSSFFSSPNLIGRILDVCHTWCGPSANLECRSPKIRHLGTILAALLHGTLIVGVSQTLWH